jgi:polysaccharide pyruvyl transferase WcaK-like protein
LAILLLVFGGVELLGEFTVTLAILAPFFIFASLGFRSQILAADSEISIGNLIRIRTQAMLVAILLGSLTIIVFFRDLDWRIWFGVTLYKSAELLIDLVTAWKQKQGANFSALLTSLVGVIILTTGAILGAVTTGEQMALILGGVPFLTFGILAVLRLHPLRSSVTSNGSLRKWVFLRNGILLGASFSLSGLIYSIPQVGLFHARGASELGALSLLLYFVLVSEVVANPLAQVWLQELGENVQNKKQANPKRMIFLTPIWLILPVFVAITTLWPIFETQFKVPEISFMTIALTVACAYSVVAFQLAGSFSHAHKQFSRSLASSIVTSLIVYWLVSAAGESMSIEIALFAYLISLQIRTLVIVNLPKYSKMELPQGPYFVIFGSANGSQNLGDQAMFDALATELRKLHPDYAIVTDSFNDEWKPQFKNVVTMPPIVYSFRTLPFLMTSQIPFFKFFEKAANRLTPNFVKVLRVKLSKFGPSGSLQTMWWDVIRNSEAVLFSGAGAINSRYALHGVHSWNLVAKWAKDLGKPVVMFGQGLGPFNSKTDFKEALALLREVDYLSVRDKNSLNFAQNLLDKSVDLGPDWATYFTPDSNTISRMKSEWSNLGSPRISLTLHKTNTQLPEKYYSDAIKAAAKLADENNTKILVLPNMYAKGNNNDTKTMSALIARLDEFSQSSFVFLPRGDLDYLETIAILANVELAITTRYHTAVFAGISQTPSLGIAIDDYWQIKLSAAQEMLDVPINVTDLKDVMKFMGSQTLSNKPRQAIGESKDRLLSQMFLRALDAL